MCVQVLPLTGPVEGGILVTIQGSNLGVKHQDVEEGVSVAGVRCIPQQQAYLIYTRYGPLLSLSLSVLGCGWLSLTLAPCLAGSCVSCSPALRRKEDPSSSPWDSLSRARHCRPSPTRWDCTHTHTHKHLITVKSNVGIQRMVWIRPVIIDCAFPSFAR